MSEAIEQKKENQNSGKSEAKLMYLFFLLRRKLLAIIATTVCMLLLVGVYIFSLPRTWQSETILLPETSAGSISGNLGALASMAGIKMNTGATEDAIYPEFYPKVLGSTVFLTEMLKENVYVGRLGKKVSIFDYFAYYQKKPWWSSLSTVKEKRVDSRVNSVRITNDQQKIVNKLSDSFFCNVDKKTDMINIKVTVFDADVAAQIADLVRNRLQIYITDYRTNKARKDVIYTKEIVNESKVQYIKAQQKYAAYCDANEEIALASFIQVRDRLENEMQMAYNMYQQSVQQMQIAQAKLQERTPVFVTIQPAAVPSKPSGPKRMLTIALFAILSVFGSFTFFWIKDIYDIRIKNASVEDKRYFK